MDVDQPSCEVKLDANNNCEVDRNADAGSSETCASVNASVLARSLLAREHAVLRFGQQRGRSLQGRGDEVVRVFCCFLDRVCLVAFQ